MSWQLIETAPKTGVHMMLTDDKLPPDHLAAYKTVGFWNGEYWVDRGDPRIKLDPTHWMSLEG